MNIDPSWKGIYRVGSISLIASATVSLLVSFLPRSTITAERVMLFQIAHGLEDYIQNGQASIMRYTLESKALSGAASRYADLNP